MTDNSKIKNIVILLTEVAVIFLMVFNVLPREAGFFVTGIMLFYFIFSPLEDSLWVFIASIPLFIALPITESFDTMANWRILLAVLFLVWLVRNNVIARSDPRFNRGKRRGNLVRFVTGLLRRLSPPRNDKLVILIIIFLVIGALSLLVADNIWLGIKKMLFLINALLLFIIIRNLAAKNKEIFPKIIGAIKVAVGITLGAGLLQLAMVFFYNLHQFWYLWDRQVINVYYGINLSNLLSYSNTWFSYYSYQLPTLRMFSVFPDSHSFAFFMILSLPLFLTVLFLWSQKKNFNFQQNRNLIFRLIFFYFLLIVGLLAIIFSGSRGAWASAIIAFLSIFFLIFLYHSPFIRSKTNFFIPRFYQTWKKQVQLMLGSLIIFFLLFPLASIILFLPQYIELGQEATMNLSFFERAKSLFDLSETSIKGRLEIWRRTLDFMVIHPVLGVGIGNFPRVLNESFSTARRGASAHNLYLDFAAETGVLGALILMAIFRQIFRDVWLIFARLKNNFFRTWAGFFILALLWIFGYSLFDVVLLNDKVFLFFIANLALLYATKSSFGFYKPARLERPKIH